ncbi:hypothetical protein ACIBJI_39905 [Nocardia sp. NPDC050408]|uniref:hypothetical protein n=1 Tax=Nocardia sp. NPDC050408 TaxID=3364319 RepID=UPI0037996BA7
MGEMGASGSTPVHAVECTGTTQAEAFQIATDWLKAHGEVVIVGLTWRLSDVPENAGPKTLIIFYE